MATSASRVLAGLVVEKFAENAGVPESDQGKFLLIGFLLGSTPVGLAMTMFMANRDADPAQPPTTVATSGNLTAAATPAPLTITSTSLPAGTVSQAYNPPRHVASGGQPPYTWSAQPLPAGLTLNASSGVISGIPASGTAGSHRVVIQAADSAGAM